MEKESNDIYYEVMMSDFVTLGKGHYERGNNASVEEINYQHGDVSAVGTMSLNDDFLKIQLQYQMAGLDQSFEYFLETQGFEVITETLQASKGELMLEQAGGLIHKVSLQSQGKTWQWQKDSCGVLLVATSN